MQQLRASLTLPPELEGFATHASIVLIGYTDAMDQTVGILHPGMMGSSVGAAAKAGGARVIWASHRRSQGTQDRAAADGLEDVGSLAELTRQSGLIFSICPPSAARDVARQVMDLSFHGVYVDANAVSPATASAIAERVQGGGANYVDGGIIGPPARERGATRLYLSGANAERAAAVFMGSPLEAVTIGEEVTKASALKMAYAAWTKGTAALLLAVRALAAREGVEPELLGEWTLSQPELTERSEGVMTRAPRKAWRFSGEMREIASTLEAAGLPEGFHRAAEAVYDRLSEFKEVEAADGAEVLAALLAQKKA